MTRSSAVRHASSPSRNPHQCHHRYRLYASVDRCSCFRVAVGTSLQTHTCMRCHMHPPVPSSQAPSCNGARCRADLSDTWKPQLCERALPCRGDRPCSAPAPAPTLHHAACARSCHVDMQLSTGPHWPVAPSPYRCRPSLFSAIGCLKPGPAPPTAPAAAQLLGRGRARRAGHLGSQRAAAAAADRLLSGPLRRSTAPAPVGRTRPRAASGTAAADCPEPADLPSSKSDGATLAWSDSASQQRFFC